MSEKINLLFVCMGNICRSPAAEGIMNAKLKAAGLDDKVVCDSAGTINYHSGNPADSRMRQTARNRDYALDSISRPILPDDLESFDLILTMDDENLANVRRLDSNNQYAEKIRPMCSYCSKHKVTEVPDPYYGGGKGFEQVLDILEDACDGLLAELKTKLEQS
jgi:protein-tyrosine phosphatase